MRSDSSGVSEIDLYQCRLVFHDDPRGAHFDLFLRVPGADQLVTYELSPAAAAGGLATEFVLAAESAASAELRAVRKQDHRMDYWTYSGPISGGRGRVVEQARGRLRCADLSNELFLRIDK